MALKKTFKSNAKKCTVTFSLPKEAAPKAKEVSLLGDFNNWGKKGESVLLKKGKDGYTGSVDLTPGKDFQFRYLVDNKVWLNDWAADYYTESPFPGIDNSVVSVPVLAVKQEKKAPATKKVVTPKAKAVKTPEKLTVVEGIGPKIAGLLNEAGILTLEDLSKAPKKNLKAVLDAAGPRYKMHTPDTWAKQAKLAATGKMDELKKLQDELKGGRKA